MSRYISEPADPYSLDPDANNNIINKTGVLLINLGTPDAPEPAAIRKYLREFLSDPRVVEIPKLIWQPILNLFVLSKRPAAIAPNYKLVWLPEGSPLLVYGQRLSRALAANLTSDGVDIKVALAMRYGQPSIANAIDELRGSGCNRILVAPLYPQYAASTTATAVDAVNAHMAKLRKQPSLRFLDKFFDEPEYIDSITKSIRDYWSENGKPSRLLLSFHGLPQSVITQGDPYFRQCMQTANLLKKSLGNDGALVNVAFQSRFGNQPWIEPSTQVVIEQWGREKLARVDVICPGFVADCLETLEEINIGCRASFIESGGGEFHFIPCLNAQDYWVNNFTTLIKKNLTAWS